ncbi:MAG: CHASE2 domain-containing protein, partial [Candidatus Omnitrophica bacterium]|nr:CHASE2 domain-containing protein [Candidatus Omnitrophota bacterium]
MPFLDKIKSFFGQSSSGKTIAPVNDLKLGVTIGLIIAAISFSGILEKYELVLLDEMFRIRGEQKIKNDIVIVEIEDQSLEILGRWPWPRSYHASLLDVLNTVKPGAVAFDILFPEADTEGDGTLASVVKKMGNVYLAAYFTIEKGTSSVSPSGKPLRYMPSLNYEVKNNDKFLKASSVTLPVTVLSDAAKWVSAVNAPPDADGSTRHLPLVIEFGNALYPTLSLQLACGYLGINAKDIKIEPNFVVLPQSGGDIRIPVDSEGKMVLNYGGPINTFERYSYIQILHDYNKSLSGGKSDILNKLKDKVILIGHTATGTIDSRIMPFSNVYPAVGAHATALSNILNRNFIARAPFALNILIVMFLSISLGALLRKGRRAVANLGIAIAMFALYGILSYILFAYFNFWINTFAPLLVIAITYVSVTINQYSTIRQEKKMLENELLIARVIQQSFLPKGYPDVQFLEFAAKCSPAKHIGGDLYDFVIRGDGKVGVVIGDVSGKGVPAALYMARTISEFRTAAHLNADPASTLKTLNDEVSKEGMEKSFITMQYVTIDLKSRQFLFSNGGHNTILHFSKNKKTIDELDTAGGMPIG